jgi:hypothetical protein
MLVNADYEVTISRTKFPDDKPAPELGQDLVETLSRRGFDPHRTASTSPIRSAS